MCTNSYDTCAHLYDLFDRKANIPFFVSYARRAGAVLDVGAGTGRIALPMAEAGASVCCVEPSTAMRRVLAGKLAARPDLAGRVSIHPGDARSMAVDRRFPLAILSGCFDHFQDHEDRRASLAHIATHLEPGGLLLFDVFLGLMKPSPFLPAGAAVVGEREYRRFVATQLLPHRRMEVRLRFETHHDGVLESEIEAAGVVGITDRAEVHAALRSAGLSVVREFGGYDHTLFREGDELLIIEATRFPPHA